MAIDRSSHRFFITVRDEPLPFVFTEEGPARQFFDKHKADVLQFIEEFLVSEFDGYFVWKQNQLHP